MLCHCLINCISCPAQLIHLPVNIALVICGTERILCLLRLHTRNISCSDLSQDTNLKLSLFFLSPFKLISWYYLKNEIILYFIKKKQADKHTRRETTKVTKENSTGKTQMESIRVWPREKRQKSSEAESFRHMKIKISYTLEDGHVGRNM
jgi:hypothetical protein